MDTAPCVIKQYVKLRLLPNGAKTFFFLQGLCCIMQQNSDVVSVKSQAGDRAGQTLRKKWVTFNTSMHLIQEL